MKSLVILCLSLVSISAFSSSCFTANFCSTGEAPRYVLCGRGQDCSRAKDHGLQFKKNCTVTWWLGDAVEIRDYSIEGNILTIKKRPGTEDIVYLLSDDRKTVTLKSNPTYVHSTSACGSKTSL